MSWSEQFTDCALSLWPPVINSFYVRNEFFWWEADEVWSHAIGQPGKWHQQVGGSVAPFGLQVIGQFVAQFHQQVKRFKLSKFVTGPLGGVVMWLIAEVVIVLMDKFSGRLADDQA